METQRSRRWSGDGLGLTVCTSTHGEFAGADRNGVTAVFAVDASDQPDRRQSRPARTHRMEVIEMEVKVTWCVLLSAIGVDFFRQVTIIAEA